MCQGGGGGTEGGLQTAEPDEHTTAQLLPLELPEWVEQEDSAGKKSLVRRMRPATLAECGVCDGATLHCAPWGSARAGFGWRPERAGSEQSRYLELHLAAAVDSALQHRRLLLTAGQRAALLGLEQLQPAALKESGMTAAAGVAALADGDFEADGVGGFESLRAAFEAAHPDRQQPPDQPTSAAGEPEPAADCTPPCLRRPLPFHPHHALVFQGRDQNGAPSLMGPPCAAQRCWSRESGTRRQRARRRRRRQRRTRGWRQHSG